MSCSKNANVSLRSTINIERQELYMNAGIFKRMSVSFSPGYEFYADSGNNNKHEVSKKN